LKGDWMDRGHLGYLCSHLRAICPGMWETNQTPAITFNCYVCLKCGERNAGGRRDSV
jgi:hypothetical protein